MSIVTLFKVLEQNEDLHLARVLILLGRFAGRTGTGTIEGLAKLAKLDFFMRYPSFLERALDAKGVNYNYEIADVSEKNNIEASMVRYKYGPWDSRYRRFINVLVAKGLVNISVRGRIVSIGLTQDGLLIARRLEENEAFTTYAVRAKLIKQNFDVASSTLTRFIYDVFPEIATLRLGEVIKYEL